MSSAAMAGPELRQDPPKSPHLVECRIPGVHTEWRSFRELTLKDAAIAMYSDCHLSGEHVVECRFVGHPLRVWHLRVKIMATFEVRGIRAAGDSDANCD